ncbi:uncharacterized protein LOC128869743 [Anastrepha ludens]|uniref:uncharacterized protein LOC128869743 n=1 Tax=Anastrepha ludens TaxID=28586 RepID=UPI0023B1100A|nr:uncharacterized protein LOC128869743 [Anastrepha ludens]
MSAINEELIAAIFKKPCLWDQQNKLFHNRQINNRNWNEISNELNVDAMVLKKKKWKQLRDTFRAELRKCPPDRSGDAGPHSVNEKCSQWSHFESMMFIKDQIKCRQSSGNLSRQKNNEVQDMNINIDEDVNNVDIEAPQYEENEYV